MMLFWGGQKHNASQKISELKPPCEIIHVLRLQRWKGEREKISDLYTPTKKYSRHAHESIKPCLYKIRALEVGAEKIFLDVTFMSKKATCCDPYWEKEFEEK